MTIYDIKPWFQSFLRPLCDRMARAGVSANQVTVLALVMSLMTGVLIWTQHASRWTLFLFPVVLFVRMALNAIDGMLAREHNMKTHLGAVLNEIGDVVSDAGLYLPLAAIPGMSAVLLVLAVVLAGLAEMAGVVAVQIGAQRRYDGPMGKSDRAFVFGMVALLIALGVPAGWWLDAVLAAVLAMLVLTTLNRTRNAMKEVRK